ncbi:DMT family transporter [Halomonas dongshanensis]|uniref:DMT family transporter n=1 Tax=Halomonas dongshanensis TaxID=2890835 RepID=A0ABT2EA84_9GAMM|nr:DMT family transporter [Halomonas dongshanensis]
MSWIALGLLAGIVLGIYDVLTKMATSKVDVISLVFLSTLFGSALWLPFFISPNILYASTGILLETGGFYLKEQFLILPKSIMMLSSWIFAYFSVKNLPLSISAGVRATGPLWTAFAAILFLGENLTLIHWLGFSVASFAYYKFATIGKNEGFKLSRDKWALFMLLATLLSSTAQIYDKFLLSNVGLDLIGVQAISAIQRAFLVIFLIPFCMSSIKNNGIKNFNIAVILVGITMVVAEFVYLSSVNIEGAMIAVISILRRTNLVVVYFVGALIFKEKNRGRKFLCITGVVFGIIIVSLPTLGVFNVT